MWASSSASTPVPSTYSRYSVRMLTKSRPRAHCLGSLSLLNSTGTSLQIHILGTCSPASLAGCQQGLQPWLGCPEDQRGPKTVTFARSRAPPHAFSQRKLARAQLQSEMMQACRKAAGALASTSLPTAEALRGALPAAAQRLYHKNVRRLARWFAACRASTAYICCACIPVLSTREKSQITQLLYRMVCVRRLRIACAFCDTSFLEACRVFWHQSAHCS